MQLILLGKVSESILKKLSLIEGYNKKLTYFFTGHSEYEFPLNHKFNLLLLDEKKMKLNTSIKFITQSYFIPVKFIDKGWRVIIGLDINTNKEYFKVLKTLSSWDDDWKKTIVLKS